MRELVGELDNVRAAWQWAAQNDRDAVAGAMQPLFLFYKIRGLFAEGAADFHLALTGGRAVGALQTRLQVRLAFFYQQVGRLAAA